MLRGPTLPLRLLILLLVGGTGACARASEARIDLLSASDEAELRPSPAEAGARDPAGPLRQDGRIGLAPGSALAYHLRIPARARLRIGSAGSDKPASFAVSLQDDERSESLIDKSLSSGRPHIDEVLLDRWAGSLGRLELSHTGHEGLIWIDRLEMLSPAPQPPRRSRGPAFGFRPNLVIYLVDTLRADRLGAYGQREPTSPRFDAFAAEAILFEDTWAQASWTRPTTGSIFTGQHPAVHGADLPDRRLSREAVTLAERLKLGGYRTGAFVANRLVGSHTGLDQGFDDWNGGDGKLYGAPSAELGARSLAWVDGGGEPFFLYVHTMDPHAPYSPAPEDAAPFEGPYAGERDTMALLRRDHRAPLHARARRFLESQYLGEIRRNDRAFGVFLEALGQRKLLERSLLLFTADHGEEFWDHGSTQHGKTLYTEQLRVPLAVRLPGAQRGGTRERGVVEQIDLYPTLLRFAGAELPESVPGRDLSAWWLGGGEAEPPLLFSEQRFTVIDKAAVRAGGLKLILNRDDRLRWRTDSRVELYDLSRDAAESVNLAASRPIAVRCLLQELDRFGKLASARRQGGDTTLSLTREDREQLRALGYLQ